MAEEITIYKDENFTVTTEYVKNWRKTYRIKNIEKVEISRNYLLFVPAGWVCGVVVWKFWPFLTGFQAGFLIITTIVLSSSYDWGTLYLQSRVVSEPAFWWYDFKTLRKVRDAVDQAIEVRNRRENKKG